MLKHPIAKMRACLDLLPPPGGEVVGECLDEIELLLKQNVMLRDAIKNYLSDNDPEGFGCACSPNHLCGPCRAARRQRPLYEALAAIAKVRKP